MIKKQSMKGICAVLFFIIILAGVAAADYSYWENATTTNLPTNARDNDWTTLSNNVVMSQNYTWQYALPAGVAFTTDTLWQLKYSVGGTVTVTNYSMASCVAVNNRLLNFSWEVIACESDAIIKCNGVQIASLWNAYRCCGRFCFGVEMGADFYEEAAWYNTASSALAGAVNGNVSKVNFTIYRDAFQNQYHSNNWFSCFYDYADNGYGIIQDYWTKIYRNGVLNNSYPKSLLHWTFDYDNFVPAADISSWSKSLEVAKTNTTGQMTASWVDGTKVYDDNWATFGYASAGTHQYAYLNYSIPLLANTTILWQVKYQSVIENLTFDTPVDAGIIILRVASGSASPIDSINLSYRNATSDWVVIRTFGSGGTFFEEQIYYWLNTTVTSGVGSHQNITDRSVTGSVMNGYGSGLSQTALQAQEYQFVNSSSMINFTSPVLRQQAVSHNDSFAVIFWMYNYSESEPVMGIVTTLNEKNLTGWAIYKSGSWLLTKFVNETYTNVTTNSSFPSNNAWHNIILSFNMNHTQKRINSTVYIDGVQTATNTTSGNGILMDGAVLYIGRYDINSSAGQFYGVLDDFAIYNSSITQSQAAMIYNRQAYITNAANGTWWCNMTWQTVNQSDKSMQGGNSSLYDVFSYIVVMDDYYYGLPYAMVNVSDWNTGEYWFNQTINVYKQYNLSYGLYDTNASVNSSYVDTRTQFLLDTPEENMSIVMGRQMNLTLIDERTGECFNMAFINASKAYWNDNLTSYDFKAANRCWVAFSRGNVSKIRVELVHTDGSRAQRFLDVNLVNYNASTIPVCANNESETWYPILMISSIPRPAIMKNTNSKCYILADYTRFAYQNGYSVYAYGIASTYTLRTTYGNGTWADIASIDGIAQTYINLDGLIFPKVVNINIQTSGLSFKSVNQTVILYYYNSRADNTALAMVITRVDTSEILYSATGFSNPNEAVIVFDYSLYNVSNYTLFKAVVTRTYTGGTEDIVRYFNINSHTGSLSNGMAFVFSLLLMIFGFSFVIARVSFSWFGIIITIFAIAITSFAVGAWYITLLQTMEFIVLLFNGLVMWKVNYQQVA